MLISFDIAACWSLNPALVPVFELRARILISFDHTAFWSLNPALVPVFEPRTRTC